MIEISKKERMAMIMNGYNPLVDQDVMNFRNRKKPSVGTQHLIENYGEYSFNSLGEKNMEAIERQYADPAFKSDVPNLKELLIESGEADLFGDVNVFDVVEQESPKNNIENSMKSYTNQQPSDINSKLKQALNKKPATNTSNDQVEKLAYNLGVKYLNAFQTLIKNPGVENRTIFLQELSNMLDVEGKYKNTQSYKNFQDGLVRAETKLKEILFRKK